MRTVGISVGSVPLGANFPEIETNFVSAILGRLRRGRITASPKLHGLHLPPIQPWLYWRSIVYKTHMFLNMDKVSSGPNSF